MSDKQTATQTVLGAITKIGERLDTVEKSIAAVEKRAAETPVYPWGTGRAPWGTTGPVGQDSAGYSVLKAAALAMGAIDESDAKEEVQANERLKGLYGNLGFRVHHQKGSFLVPFSSAHIAPVAKNDADARFVGELRQKMLVGGDKVDPDEMRWIAKRLGGEYGQMWTKALGTLDDTTGGVLRGFPTLGELVDLQRNLEVFANAGASELPLPPNGLMDYPKLTGGATAFMVGEGSTITESNATTGSVRLQAKKMAILTRVNNELFRFVNPSSEAMIRMDMSRVGALKADQQMMHGTGGKQVLGLMNYETTTAWTTGVDKLIQYTSIDEPADANTGYLLQPEDIANMEAMLPDAVQAPTSWVMRRRLFSAIKNRRADAVTPGDGKGMFVFDVTRSVGDGQKLEMYGTKAVRSSQIPRDRVRGTNTALTYLLLGYFPDWIIGRSGVMEFLASNVSDTAITNDQTFLRAIQHFDGAARHAASFVFCDQLQEA